MADHAQISVTAYNSADNFTIVVENGLATIFVDANDYLKAINIHYPVVFDKTTTIDLSATGAKIEGTVGTYEGLEIDATNGKFADNNGGWVQVNAGTIITFHVNEEAAINVTPYSSIGNFALSVELGLARIEVLANDYINSIQITYPIVYSETTTIDLSATGAKIEGTVGVYEGLEIDATNGKFADNNGGWTQVNAGTIIMLRVAEGAEISVTAYSSADNFSIHVYDNWVEIEVKANDYLKSIQVSYN